MASAMFIMTRKNLEVTICVIVVVLEHRAERGSTHHSPAKRCCDRGCDGSRAMFYSNVFFAMRKIPRRVPLPLHRYVRNCVGV